MSRTRLLAAATLACLAPSVAGAKPAPEVYGPAPDWERYKALAEPAVLAKLPDPANWSVAWPHGYTRRTWRHKGRFTGYLTCGILIAKTPPPDGRATINFVAVIDHDKVQTIDISQRMSNSLVNVQCADAISRGVLAPARLMPGFIDRRAIDTLGLIIQIKPEGALVSTVVQGSLAERAGINSGTVISHANGIALAGMGPAMADVLKSDISGFRLQATDGRTFKIKRGP